jgi:predicted RNase H-like nuclease
MDGRRAGTGACPYGKICRFWVSYPMLFLGLDLAWGRKNTSGGCVVSCPPDAGGRGFVLEYTETLSDDDEIVRWVSRWNDEAGPDGLLLGVDAPLLVPNMAGKRPCETTLGQRFARFQAGAHPANRTIFGGDVRGERLVSRLAEIGIAHDPYLSAERQTGMRQMMEVFPHPAHIVLFGLAKTLKYKPKPKRSYETRWAAMNDYSRLLRSLAQFDPPLDLPTDWPPADVTGQIGSGLKRLEDGMDALTCAYIVFWYWHRGAAGAEVIGDMTEGYVVIPQMPKVEEQR